MTHADLFELDNARNQNEEELPQTFVETPIFSRMLSAKNQILMGCRGSGKTAILKMLSHSYLSRYVRAEGPARSSHKKFIGIYIPITTLWLGALRYALGGSDEAQQRDFLWVFSLAACQSLLRTSESCLSSYLPDLEKRVAATGRLIDALQKRWLPSETLPFRSLSDLGDALAELSSKRSDYEARQYIENPNPALRHPFAVAPHFMSATLGPLVDGIAALAREIGAPSGTNFLLCIDEVETLSEPHQRILNSFMRSQTGNLFFKIALLPFAHKTLKTNLADPLRVTHDFEYLWIEEDPARDEPANTGAIRRSNTSPESFGFARQLYAKQRTLLHHAGLNIEEIDHLFGPSLILRPIDVLNRRLGSGGALATFTKLGETHFDETTKARMERLSSLPVTITDEIEEEDGAIATEYADQLLRKSLGFLLLRDQLASKRGRKNGRVYFGTELIVRLADGNPRTLVRLMNLMIREGNWKKGKHRPLIRDFRQHQLAVRFSKAMFERLLSEESPGPRLYEFVGAIGRGLEDLFYKRTIGSDHVGQFRMDSKQFEEYREIIELGFALGVVKGELRPGPDFTLPQDGGVFRLTYCLSPAFNLMPRKGQIRSLSSVLTPSFSQHQPEFDFSDE